MKSIINLIIAIVFFSGTSTGQESSVVGTWYSKDGDDEYVLICQANYIVITNFNKVNTAFYYSSGGSYKAIKDRMIASLEFTTSKHELQHIKTLGQLQYTRSEDKLSIIREDSSKVFLSRVDNGQADLAGVWRLAGQQGELKSLLVISGHRFQRIHFNPKTKELIGSYGGRYEYSDGKYTEHIDFYKKDGDKIGTSVSFTLEVNKTGMVIKGKNEKGEEVEELWKR